MDSQTLHTLEVAEEAATELVEACRKNQALYRERPQQVAQVSRTAKWLLSAITKLRRSLVSSETSTDQQS